MSEGFGAMPYLHIIDNHDASIRETSAARSTPDRLVICAESVDEVTRSLDRLVTENRFFDRVLFETHGRPGEIVFGREALNAAWMNTNWRNRNYSRLTPGLTRIYFNGCNVAAGESGWQFLEATARVFLNRGEVFGHTSLGLVFPIYSTLTGHVVHLDGSARKVTKVAGDPFLQRSERSDL